MLAGKARESTPFCPGTAPPTSKKSAVGGGSRGNAIRVTGPAALRGQWHSERGSEKVSERVSGDLRGAFCDSFSNTRQMQNAHFFLNAKDLNVALAPKEGSKSQEESQCTFLERYRFTTQVPKSHSPYTTRFRTPRFRTKTPTKCRRKRFRNAAL